MKIIDGIRSYVRKTPKVRACLLPWWIGLRSLLWNARKFLQTPVVYAAGNTSVKLYPDGQIPEMLWKGNFESTERDFVAAYLKPGMRVINVGANVGLYTVMASALVGPSGKVHAFEPSSGTYIRLKKNLDLNNCSNVVATRIALSNQTGQLLLRVDPLNPSCDGHRFVEEVLESEKVLSSDELVEASTLDEYMADQPRNAVDLIIMDVEGAELAVLQGGIETITNANLTILMECSKYQEDTEKLLTEMGYRFWVWNVSEQVLMPVDFRQAARLGDVVVRRAGWTALP